MQKTLRKDLAYYYIVRMLLKRFVLPILPLYMLHAGLSIPQIGAIATMAYITALLLEIPSGMVSDTLGHKRTLILSLVGQGAAMVLYLGGSFWWIAAGSALYFGSGAFMSGTLQALLYERLDECNQAHNYHKFHSRSKAISHFYSLVTLALTGVAYAWHWWLPFVIGVIHFSLAALAASRFTQAKQIQSVQQQEGFWAFITHFPTALKQLRAHTNVLWVILLNGVVVGIGMGSGDFHQVVFEHLGLAVIFFGVAYSVKRLGQLLSYLSVSTLIERVQMSTFLTINVTLIGVYLLLTPLMDSPWSFVLVATLASIAYGLMSIGVDNYINVHIPSGSRATALSMATFFRAIIMAISAVSIGLLSSTLGLEHTFGVFGIIVAVFVVVTYPWMYAACKHKTT